MSSHPSLRRQAIRFLCSLAGAMALALVLLGAGRPARAAAGADHAQVVDLVQVPGHFKQDRLTLRPGSYIFRIHNESVDHGVSFHLSQMNDDGSVGQPVANSVLAQPVNRGEVASTGVVELRAGKYSYRCALNPTPRYFLYVQ